MGIAPVGFRERRVLRIAAVADGGERRSEHHALDAGITRGAKNTKSAFARGDDQIVFVLWDAWGQRRRDVQNVVATGDSFGPACVFFQIGSEEF